MPPTTWADSMAFPATFPRPKHINHFGVSGGKDSTALLLWALHESGYPRESLDVTFCDTGNEAPETYAYVRYLEQHLQIGITWIKPGLDFWELALRKNRFPSAKARFCTYWLKIRPTIDYINAVFRAGHTLTLHSGVRAAESDLRAKLVEEEFDGNFLCNVRRPLLALQIGDIWQMHEKYGVKPNPLYRLGMARVGCFPCVMSRKKEIKRIAEVKPEMIDRIRQRESAFPDGSYHSFFASKTCPNRFHTRAYTNRKGKRFTVATIDDIVAWSQTGKGAKLDPRHHSELLAIDYDRLPATEDAGCGSTAGFCE